MKEKILVSDPDIQSQAAQVLLRRELLRHVVPHQGWQGWLRFRLETLERWLAERGELRCHYCNCGPLAIDADNHHPDVATLDHVIPQHTRRFHRYDLKNLVVACFPCNQNKGGKIRVGIVKIFANVDVAKLVDA